MLPSARSVSSGSEHLRHSLLPLSYILLRMHHIGFLVWARKKRVLLQRLLRRRGSKSEKCVNPPIIIIIIIIIFIIIFIFSMLAIFITQSLCKKELTFQ